MWLLQYELSYYGQTTRARALYSTKGKAIEAFPDLLDTHSRWEDDWKNGLKGFGKEDEDNYVRLDCLVVEICDDGGVLLTNTNCDMGSGEVNVLLERMQVDPPKEEKCEEEKDTSIGNFLGLNYQEGLLI